MEVIRFGKSVKRVVALQRTPAGQVVAVEIYDRKRKKRKGTVGLRTIERVVRHFAEAQRAAAGEYVDRHNSSNRKRRNGWLFRLPMNIMRAQTKMGRKMFRMP